jgi:hypothetical protein
MILFAFTSGGQATITYFGQCYENGIVIGNADDITGGYTQFSYSGAKTYTCPGTGNQILRELGVYIKNGEGNPLVRVGIYYENGTLLAQGTQSNPVMHDQYSWVTHDRYYLPENVILVGGQNYKFAMYNGYYSAGTTIMRYQTGGSSGDVKYITSPTDYSGGLPTTLPSGDDWSGWWCFRAGVEPMPEQGFTGSWNPMGSLNTYFPGNIVFWTVLH